MPESIAVTPHLLRDWPLPEPSGSKAARGQALVIGGSRATAGATKLAGLSALRVGAGRLSIGLAESVAPILAIDLPECGAFGLAEDKQGSVTGLQAKSVLASELDRADVILVGPGLDTPDGAKRLVELVARETDVTVVLDAFALGVLPDVAQRARDALNGRLVLTPNAGELARILDAETIEEDELPEAVTTAAKQYGATVSAQGFVGIGSELWQLTTGDTGLGTSGSGDVLAGAITGLRARGAALDQAAVWATHVHAAAGDSLSARVGRIGFLASELLGRLPQELQILQGD
ncbi:yjeF C-terminal region, hydroxyethylthiazole kinase-related [Bowdeniella nasicola]|uniref:ADP-dependent (S)-NAD(P)H-hydrate dehydratase n=1 Tax=Bowdeniella nasicola TaxID=208480 RepID=A0A1H4AN36_9ACTO|nr:NAD(P)H-hydrate dehydratase [Bowdeniella nasicola]SEA37157.1 yjeF C-terminal region, hydroxyethylthiazole kinase-related [Bowdeniella nasicola]